MGTVDGNSENSVEPSEESKVNSKEKKQDPKNNSAQEPHVDGEKVKKELPFDVSKSSGNKSTSTSVKTKSESQSKVPIEEKSSQTDGTSEDEKEEEKIPPSQTSQQPEQPSSSELPATPPPTSVVNDTNPQNSLPTQLQRTDNEIVDNWVNGLVSTRDIRDDNNKEIFSYKRAVLQGLAPDGGLLVPKIFPKITDDELGEIFENSKKNDFNYVEIALEIKKRLVGNSIDEETLKGMLENAYYGKDIHGKRKFSKAHIDEQNASDYVTNENNVVPVREIGDKLYLQNLSLGPTLAFKDMALQQLAEEMNYFLEKEDRYMVIIGSTSGDTGSSAEAAFKGKNRILLFMLSPEEGMSEFQKGQMAGLEGDNIFNISVKDKFDVAQGMVKEIKGEALFDNLGAVNSINWGRISSQTPYYLSGYLQTIKQAGLGVGAKIDVVVPTGNFGNIYSAYVAKKMGVPIRNLIIATNENDVMSRLLENGEYDPGEKTTETTCPSMDITKPSNFERLLYDVCLLNESKFNDNLSASQRVTNFMEDLRVNKKVVLSKHGLDKYMFNELGFYAYSSTDAQRKDVIAQTKNENEDIDNSKKGDIIDPHTAAGVYVAGEYKTSDAYNKRDDLKQEQPFVPILCMETALPNKFEDTVREAIGTYEPENPYKGTDYSEKFKVIGSNDMNSLREYIVKCIDEYIPKKESGLTKDEVRNSFLQSLSNSDNDLTKYDQFRPGKNKYTAS